MTAGRARFETGGMIRFAPAAVAAAATAALLVASASGQSQPTTLHLVDHEKYFAFTDVKPKGIEKKTSQGDTVYLGGILTGDSKGRSHLVCTATLPGRKRAQYTCNGILALAGGDIAVEGRTLNASNLAAFAVTGGTGDYAGAAGTIATHGHSGSRTDIVITLTS
jgi:hypothetical protein